MNGDRPLAHVERVAWLRLARTRGVGPLTFQRLIGRFRNAAAALEALPRLSDRLAPPSVAEAERELEALADGDARLLCACEPDYPPLLKQLSPCPPTLCVRGRVELAHRPTVALVGAREASAAGLKLAGDFARDLGAAGYVVVSGLARGVDARAHEAALGTGTIAVMAGGLDRPYPPQNLALFERIADEGLVMTEAPLGFQARARDFPRRNHIISGVSLGVVVVEAAQRSGSLITARAAAEQGRDVMAAPASPLDPRGRGCNELIRQGATLVESAADIAEALGAAPSRLRRAVPVSLFPDYDEEVQPEGLSARLALLLSPTPMHVNDLARLLAASAGAVSAALMELELAGRAASLPGGFAALPAAAFT